LSTELNFTAYYDTLQVTTTESNLAICWGLLFYTSERYPLNNFPAHSKLNLRHKTLLLKQWVGYKGNCSRSENKKKI
jgi:hypothetical protein